MARVASEERTPRASRTPTESTRGWLVITSNIGKTFHSRRELLPLISLSPGDASPSVCLSRKPKIQMTSKRTEETQNIVLNDWIFPSWTIWRKILGPVCLLRHEMRESFAGCHTPKEGRVASKEGRVTPKEGRVALEEGRTQTRRRGRTISIFNFLFHGNLFLPFPVPLVIFTVQRRHWLPSAIPRCSLRQGKWGEACWVGAWGRKGWGEMEMMGRVSDNEGE